ncbi:MAG: hypothetical protein OEU93_15340 [Rubrivivax sp.]|nr:hypothetical protein [Rubrivivax sp.]
MPAPVLHLGATVMCMHAGQAMPAAPFPRVLVSGQPVVTLASPYVVAGCALTGTGAPPCVTAQWMVGATRVMAGGAPLLTFAGQSLCTPSGSPLLPMVSQMRVLAT